MTDNSIYSTKTLVDVSMISEYGYLTLSAIQRIFLSAAETHFRQLKIDVPYYISTYGISWVMLSTTLEIHTKVKPSELLTVKTWWTWHEGILYRREFAAYCEDETLAVAGTTFFAMIDMHTRKLYKTSELPFTIPFSTTGEELLKAESRILPLKTAYTTLFKCPVMNSWLDELGHVNNFHYGEFVYDTLTEEEQQNLHRLHRFEIYFTGELRKGDTIQMNRADTPEFAEITGTRQSDGHSAFIARLFFSK